MQRTFEETYPLYPFSELVRLSMKLGQWIGRRRDGQGSMPAGEDLVPEGAD